MDPSIKREVGIQKQNNQQVNRNDRTIVTKQYKLTHC